MSSVTRSSALILVIFLVAGCATAPRADRDRVAGAQIGAGIYDTKTGQKLSPDELFDRLAGHSFVVVGESHDDPWQHRIQTRILREMAMRRDAVALGMEMFQRPFQDALDAYVAGQIEEATMLERTEYEKRWGFQADFYRPMWRSARQGDFPLVALNARQELSKKIAHHGLEGLNADERADVPTLDLGNQAHRAYVRKAFEQHDMEMSDQQFERFYAAQVLWDETMADTAVDFMHAHPAVETMVIVAGRAHAHRAFGIPPRIERRLEPDSGQDVVVVQPVNLARTGDKAPTLDELRSAADYVWVGPGR